MSKWAITFHILDHDGSPTDYTEETDNAPKLIEEVLQRGLVILQLDYSCCYWVPSHRILAATIKTSSADNTG